MTIRELLKGFVPAVGGDNETNRREWTTPQIQKIPKVDESRFLKPETATSVFLIIRLRLRGVRDHAPRNAVVRNKSEVPEPHVIKVLHDHRVGIDAVGVEHKFGPTDGNYEQEVAALC